MNSNKRDAFGTQPLGTLLRNQAIPASAGILVMSIYGIVDTIFVGLWVGPLGIAAITVVQPITFLIASIGMAIGVGGASIISRAFGEGKDQKAFQTFGNQVGLTLTLGVGFVIIGFPFIDQILTLFGGRGDVQGPAREYFTIVLLGTPFLAWAMMSNNVIRAEGYPKIAMLTIMIPAVVNIILDPIFIVGLDMGIAGAAWATTISYMASAGFATWFFLKGGSQLEFRRKSLTPNLPVIKEITSLGAVTFARQGTISLLSIVLNNSLFIYGGEIALSIYGIIGRLLMFANFPVLGITQGFVPIVGYNYGARLMDRVNKLIRLSMASATLISLGIFAVIMVFAPHIVSVFTNDPLLIERTTPALRAVFLATPLLAINLLGSAYFQAIGRARPALILSLSKQGFILIPLFFILPYFFGIYGIWYSFPIADTGAAIITAVFLKYVRDKNRRTAKSENEHAGKMGSKEGIES
ncbi:MATE family efflux transporter [Rhodohalobacter sp. 8-1]|uniref:MATE family efflux transporter n=1 Tax=Rhodohalobacter sp. 8-1 TaxID=3131972 RepID=UPI0030EEDE56